MSIEDCELLAYTLTLLYKNYNGDCINKYINLFIYLFIYYYIIVLILVSSDMSHYYPQNMAQSYDMATRMNILSGKAQNVYECFNQRQCEACGMYPIIVLMIYYESFQVNNIIDCKYSDSCIVIYLYLVNNNNYNYNS